MNRCSLLGGQRPALGDELAHKRVDREDLSLPRLALDEDPSVRELCKEGRGFGQAEALAELEIDSFERREDRSASRTPGGSSAKTSPAR